MLAVSGVWVLRRRSDVSRAGIVLLALAVSVAGKPSMAFIAFMLDPP